MNIAAIIPAAGAGRRLKSKTPKPFVRVIGKPLVIHTLERLKRAYGFREVILAVAPGKVRTARRLLKDYRLENVRVVEGGDTRARSVWNGLRTVSPRCTWVLVHDAARPLVSPGIVRRLLGQTKKAEALISAVAVKETLKHAAPGGKTIQSTQDRSHFFLAQTPQVFKKNLLLDRYRALGAGAWKATDESALFDGSEIPVRIVAGEARNIKITTADDLELFKYYLNHERRRVSGRRPKVKA